MHHGFLGGGFSGFSAVNSVAGSALNGGIVQPPSTNQVQTPDLKEPTKVRNVFPETWLWTNTTIGYFPIQLQSIRPYFVLLGDYKLFLCYLSGVRHIYIFVFLLCLNIAITQFLSYVLCFWFAFLFVIYINCRIVFWNYDVLFL